MISPPIILAASDLPCSVTAPTAFLINAENGKVLFSKNIDSVFYPASTTKVATALYTLEKKGSCLDEVVTVSSNAIAIVSPSVRRSSGKHPSYRLEFGGTLMGLKAGEQVDIKSLLYGLMLRSGNDAANVLAEAVSGSVDQFMVELNQFLISIGCNNTNFNNPHGLTSKEHVTTARDLATMALFGMKNPIFREIVGSTRYVNPATNKQEEKVFTQNNALLKPGHKHFYPHAIGIKTGYTIQAGYPIIAAARQGDRSLIAVVTHFEAVDKRYRNVIQLFDEAFAEVKKERTLLSRQHDLFYQKVRGGKTPLKGGLLNDVVISFYPSEDKQFYPHIEWMELSAPITEGQKVGEVQIFDEEGSLHEVSSIVAISPIEATWMHRCHSLTEEGKKWIHTHRAHIAYVVASFLVASSFMLPWIRRRYRAYSKKR